MNRVMKRYGMWVALAVGVVFLGMTGCSGVAYKSADLNYMAKYKVSIGDLRGSLPELEEVLKMNPKDVDANATMAQVQYRLGDIGKAAKYAKAAHEVDPGDFRALGILGLVDLREGRYEEGIQKVSKAMAIYNDIEQVGGSVPVEPEAILKNMKVELQSGKKISPDLISQLEGAFWKKIQWYEFDEEYRKWHFHSFYDVRPDGGDTFPK